MIKNLTITSENGIRVDKKFFHKLICQLRRNLEFTVEFLEINFVTSETIHKINKEYLSHDYTTDIITFNYSGENYKFDGEIFISFDDAAENAGKYGCSLDSELLRLVVHGVLHLLGYNDIKESERKGMKNIENKLVDEYKFLINNKIVL